MSREIASEIVVDAPAERVWQVLTDFDAHPDWNPFIERIRGRAEAGARLEVRIVPPGGRGMTFRPTVTRAEPGRELAWLGKLFVPGLFDGEHRFRIEPLDARRVRFVQSERFSGALVPLLAGGLRKTERGFAEMNQALKQRAEASP